MAALDTAQRGPSNGQPHLELGKIHPAYLSLFAFPKLRPPILWLFNCKGDEPHEHRDQDAARKPCGGSRRMACNSSTGELIRTQ